MKRRRKGRNSTYVNEGLTRYTEQEYSSLNTSDGVISAILDLANSTGKDFDDIWDDGILDVEADAFYEAMLANLDISEEELNEIQNLQPGKTQVHVEYWGDTSIECEFENLDGTVIVRCESEYNDGPYSEFDCKF